MIVSDMLSFAEVMAPLAAAQDRLSRVINPRFTRRLSLPRAARSLIRS